MATALNKEGLKTFPQDYEKKTLCEILEALSTYNSGNFGFKHDFKDFFKNINISSIQNAKNYTELLKILSEILKEITKLIKILKNESGTEDKIEVSNFLIKKISLTVNKSKKIVNRTNNLVEIKKDIENLELTFDAFYKAKKTLESCKVQLDTLELQKKSEELYLNSNKFKFGNESTRIENYEKEVKAFNEELKKMQKELKKLTAEFGKRTMFKMELIKLDICNDSNELDKKLSELNKHKGLGIVDFICKLFNINRKHKDSKINVIEKYIAENNVTIDTLGATKEGIEDLNNQIEEKNKKITELKNKIEEPKPTFLKESEAVTANANKKLENIDEKINNANEQYKEEKKKVNEVENKYKEAKEAFIKKYDDSFSNINKHIEDSEKNVNFDKLHKKISNGWEQTSFNRHMKKYL